MMDLKDAITAEAKRLGFLLCGVLLPEPPPSFTTYQRWIAQGRQAGMAYLATERALRYRAEPHLVLPDVQSILVLGYPYPAPEVQPPAHGAPPGGRVAAYAALPDYHLTLPPLLERIVEFTEQLTGRPLKWRAYSDTGPILEKDWAARAGLGWIGKNSCLISPRYGSYFLLAEILWDLPLAPDPPLKSDYCGSCTRCLQACPTACILPDRTLNAQRCIAYLTIENKGAIAPELRPALGDWIFGCDICQEVCPWNIRFAAARPMTLFAQDQTAQRPLILEELHHSPQTFNRKYRRSPLLRAKRRGMLRNISVVLGNLGDTENVAALIRLLREDQEALVRAHAAWALGQIGGESARAGLLAALEHEAQVDVRREIEQALRQF